MTRALSEIFLDLEEGDDLPWHIDARDNDPRSEETRQVRFLGDAKIICPGVAIFAVPNGGKRSQWAAMKAKREGMKAGVLDLVCTWSGRGVAFIEMKNGTDMPTKAQREFLNGKFREGHFCGVFRRPETALEFLRSCGAPFIGRLT
jgi:hypothetical protein